MIKRRFALTLLGCGLAVVLTPSLARQTATHVHGAASVRGSAAPTAAAVFRQQIFSSLPTAVDGSKSPDRIPDTLAYRHLIMALAGGSTPSRSEARRRSVLMKHIGVSAGDAKALFAALANTRNQLNDIQRARTGLSAERAAERATLDSLRAQEHGALDAARVRIRESLSAAGSARLQTFIDDYMKPRIVILGAEAPADMAR